jgi:ornithine cyclodeaminase/alanine dehydrogenase-like protein (mu-crystallin family)
MLQLNAAQIEQALPFAEIIEIVKRGILQYEKGHYHVPDRMHLERGALTYLLMPAMGPDYFCTKLVAVVPQNRTRALPIISGSLILHRSDTGQPVAMMDAPMITALRTAAVGALGLQLISPSATSRIGIIGCGVQGTWQSIFSTVVRPVSHLYCFSRRKERFAQYLKKVKAYCSTPEIIWCESAEEVVTQSEVVYTCTTSSKPVFANDLSLVEGRQFISVGSFRKSMQELPDAVYQQAHQLIIDTPTALQEVGDVINVLDKCLIGKDQIITLGSLLMNAASYQEGSSSVFKSVGMAAFDLALAEAVYTLHSYTK